MTAPVAMDDALPLLSTNPLVGRNNSRDIRKFLFEGLMLLPQGNFTRRGVFHRGWVDPVTLEPLELKVLESGPGPNVVVNSGLFTVHRGAIGAVTNEGPYVGGSLGQFTIPLTIPAAPTLNHRYDVVYSKIMDKNIVADAAGSEHGPYVDVRSGVAGAVLNINGTPGSAGAPPTTPDGYLPLAFLQRNQNDNVISQATDIIDCRRGTALPGQPRVLFPWDESNIATDVGNRVGEARYRRAIAPYPVMIDVWDGLTWRGTRGPIPFTQPAQTASGNLGPGGSVSMASGKVTIPWPGFPYKIRGIGQVIWSAASGAIRQFYGEINLDSDVYTHVSGGGNVPPATALGWTSSVLPNGGETELTVHAPTSATVSDGNSHSVSFWIQASAANVVTATVVQGFSYKFAVEIVPA